MSVYGSSGRDEFTVAYGSYRDDLPDAGLSEQDTEPQGGTRTVRIEPRDDAAPQTVPVPPPTHRMVDAPPQDGRTRFDLVPGAAPARVTDDRGFTAPPVAAGGEIRIGGGVTAPPARRGTGAGRRAWRRATRALSGLTTVVLLAAAGWVAWQWWQSRHHPVTVTHVAVAPAKQLNNTCDVEYDIIGTISTTGGPGTVSYEWLRSDGQDSGTLTQSVPAGQSSTRVHLYWRFTGKGSITATATLRVLGSPPAEATTKVPYTCR